MTVSEGTDSLVAAGYTPRRLGYNVTNKTSYPGQGFAIDGTTRNIDPFCFQVPNSVEANRLIRVSWHCWTMSTTTQNAEVYFRFFIADAPNQPALNVAETRQSWVGVNSPSPQGIMLFKTTKAYTNPQFYMNVTTSGPAGYLFIQATGDDWPHSGILIEDLGPAV